MTREDDIDQLARLAVDTRDFLNEHSTTLAVFVYVGIPIICFVYYTYCQWRDNA